MTPLLLLLATAVPADAVAPYLAKHCAACHDAKTQKGRFRVDTLPAAIDAGSRARWQAAYERVRAGEMPPPKHPRPDADATKAFLAAVEANLAAADPATQSGLRRLNRVEYGTILRDLLGITADLGDLLPEDGSAAGFDTVGEALQISPVLLERYLAAADAALDAATTKGPRPTSRLKVATFAESRDIAAAVKAGNFIGYERGAAVLYNGTGHTPYGVREFYDSPPGRYRVKVEAFAHNSGGKPLALRVYAGNFFTGQSRSVLCGIFDVSPDGTTITTEAELLSRLDTVRPMPCDCGPVYRKDGDIAKHTGPGIGVKTVSIEGPLTDEWPSRGHVFVYGAGPLERGTAARAREVLSKSLPQLFRRPLRRGELERYAAIASKALSSGETFESAMRQSVKSALCSPHFLLVGQKSGKLDGHDLATRLSLMLWSSCPDAALTADAAAGRLDTDEGRKAAVKRMLADPKAARFTENFTGQWLKLRDIDFTTPDAKLYPEYDDWLRASMPRETHAFFDEVLKNDRPLTDFVESDWTIIDGRLARHYGIDGVEGTTFRKVSLKPEHKRGGVLTHASVLKVTANGTTTSPVVRGAFVLDRILGRPVPPPPPNVPAVEPDIRGATGIRTLLAKHRSVEACATCHNRMDPPGFALEGYDPIGGYRERYRIAGISRNRADVLTLRTGLRDTRVTLGPKVDAADALPDGRTFSDLAGYKKLVVSDPDSLARAMAEKLLAYGTGRVPGPRDRAAVEAVVAVARRKGYGFRTLLEAVTESESFLTR